MKARHSRNLLATLLVVCALLLFVAQPAAGQTFKRRPGKDGATNSATGEAKTPAADSAAEVPQGRTTVEQLKRKLDAGEKVIVLDVRSDADYRGSLVKIAGAVRIPPDQIEAHLSELSKESEVVAYCSCEQEATSLAVAEQLRSHGFSRVSALLGGFDSWVDAGYPIEPRNQPREK
jgi:rhodanese-related sulfurtransferase